MRRSTLQCILFVSLLFCGCQTATRSTPQIPSQSTVSKPAPASVRPSATQPTTVQSAAATSPEPTLMAGVIEGFYGKPWSISDTKQIITFIHAHGMNTFVYAPKDDLYQRKQWRQLYPAKERVKLQQLVQASKAAHVRFIGSLSPGNHIQYSNPNDVRLLTAKVDQLREMDVQTLLLSFDDIPKSLDAQDARVYHGNLALAQVELANHLLAYEQARDPQFRIIFVPTVYNGVADNPYWRTIASQLNRTIPVVWTGPGILSARVTPQAVRRVESELRHPLVIWDNYPVNDFTYVQTHHPQLFLGPVIGRDKRVPSMVAGYWFNPMLQARASEIPLWTAADYLRHPQTYQPAVSWSDAIHTLGGQAAPAFHLFAEDASTYGKQVPPPSPPNLTADMKAYWQHPSQQTATVRLRGDFAQMETAAESLQWNLPDRQLWAELAPFAAVFAEEGSMGELALEIQSKRQHHEAVQPLLTKLSALYDQRLHNPRIVAGTAVDDFVLRVLKANATAGK